MREPDIIISQDEAVRTLTINRPKTRNGLAPATTERLAAAIEAANADSTVRCLVVTGAGEAFCSGADLAASMAALETRSHAEIIREGFHRIIRALDRSEIPSIASIRGAAVGFGFDLALACDLRVVSKRSTLGAIFGSIGLVPDGGSSFSLARLVGLARALEIVLLAELFSATRADQFGLVTRLVEDSELETATWALATKLAQGAPRAIRLARRNLLRGQEGSLDEALCRELNAQVECLASADFREGVAAFFEKRPPQFTGE